jgi:membrane-bound inhibitor of C-type lysozyme
MMSSAAHRVLRILLSSSLALAACRPSTAPPHATAPSTEATTTVVFACANGRSITATFRPESDAYVDVVLSDGRSVRLPRAMSASGARYATSDEGMVFWNKGNTAFVTEGGENGRQTYSDCEHRE